MTQEVAFKASAQQLEKNPQRDPRKSGVSCLVWSGCFGVLVSQCSGTCFVIC